VAAAAAGLLVLLTTACGSSSNAASSTSPTSTESAATAAGSLAVAQSALGPIVVDGAGMTVYLLTADSADHSTCDAACLAKWPAVAGPATGDPTATGISVAVGATTTPTGTETLTVGGLPVYTFVQDQAPGDTTGEGVTAFGGTWYAVSPDGSPVMAAGSSSGGYGRSY
jgi:predicted lipoprotein with Yx(FWY)xxD motif